MTALHQPLTPSKTKWTEIEVVDNCIEGRQIEVVDAENEGVYLEHE